jgi:hypothetical protein
LFLSGLAAAGAAACIAIACSDQPKVKCTIQRGVNASALYKVVTVVDGPPEGCLPGGATGETLGIEAYNAANSDRTNADLNKGSMAIKGQSISDALGNHDPDTANSPNSVGDFSTTVPGGDNFCDVPTMTTAEQNLAYVPMGPDVPPPADAGPEAGPTPGTPPVPAQHITYKWTNVRVYVTAATPGLQMVGDLDYSNDTGLADGGAGTHCEAKYRVSALLPNIGCGFDTSALVDGGATIPDDRMCGATADINHTVTYMGMELPNPLATGSGISPDFAVHCDKDLLICVLDKEPPSLK